MRDVKETPVTVDEAVQNDTIASHGGKVIIELAGAFETVRWGKIVHIRHIKRKIGNDGKVTWRGDRVPVRAYRIEVEGLRPFYRFECN